MFCPTAHDEAKRTTAAKILHFKIKRQLTRYRDDTQRRETNHMHFQLILTFVLGVIAPHFSSKRRGKTNRTTTFVASLVQYFFFKATSN